MIILVLGSSVLTCCGTYGAIRLYRLSLGMTKQKTISTLGRRPDNLIGAKNTPYGQVEVLQYSRYDPWVAQLQERYWLYFLNDTLRSWGRPGDWEREADKIYEYRIR